jgi:hypothetical protein
LSKPTEGELVARKTVFVSDLTGEELTEGDQVTITIKFTDARRGQYHVDAHPDDPEVQRLVSAGTRQARRGRKPRSTARPNRRTP